MCGIVGIAGRSINSVTSHLSHRGPDATDEYRSTVAGKNVYLGHTRLAIIDLSAAGTQPMRAGDVSITYNGEIYNYQELRDDLAQEYNFTSDTDTEVILHGYREWGIERLLSKLNGMFAFGILDESANQLVIARDQMGVKPIYYWHEYDAFGFASEAKALFAAGVVKPRLNHDVLPEYLANYWVHEPRTLFADINKLPAGTFAVFNLEDSTMETTDYWDLWRDQTSPREPLTDLLPTVVSDQMVADVPVGSYLSGGIDSTIVTHYAASKRANLTALNLDNSTGAKYDEHANIWRLSELDDIKLDVFEPAADMGQIYKDMIYHMDEPIADPAIIPAYLLANQANKNGIKVMLSGMGGDELFGGYKRMKIIRWRNLLHWGWPIAAATSAVCNATNTFRIVDRVAEFIKNPSPERYHTLTYYFNRNEISALVRDNKWVDEYDAWIRSQIPSEISGAKRFQYLDWQGYLSSHNFMYVDKASMAAGIEVRVPLTDRRVAEQWFDLPIADQQRNGLKTPLRDAVRSELGPKFTKHSKQGFSFPIEMTLDSDNVKSDLNQMRDSDRLTSIIDSEALKQVLDHWEASRSFTSGMKVWNLYTLFLWLNEFDVKV